jgi:hypothetical protein
VDHRTLELERDLWDELASCLERFLAATADERTLQRAREALALWGRVSESYEEQRHAEQAGDRGGEP